MIFTLGFVALFAGVPAVYLCHQAYHWWREEQRDKYIQQRIALGFGLPRDE